jgi:hypothetical protein
MPDGSTGAITEDKAGCVDAATGTGTGMGVGGGGVAGKGSVGDSEGSLNVGVGLGSSFRDRGINRAVSDAPAKADVAAMMAMVVLDMCRGGEKCQENAIKDASHSQRSMEKS